MKAELQALSRMKRHWSLWMVLVIQAALTIPWVVGYGASSDEALYLRAGREEWAYWILHTPIPQNFSSFFSGSLFLWPPLGAIGNEIAGVAGARTITLLLMLGVTSLTYFTGLRMGDRLVAGFAAALAGLTGLESYLGASATFEPLALFFLMLAVYMVVRAQGNWRLLIAAGGLLALSDFTKYGIVAWDVIVLGIAVLYGYQGWHSALRRGLLLLGCLAASDGLLLLAGGSSAWRGIRGTTITRAPASSTIAAPVGTVVAHSAALIGVVLFLAVFGVIMSRVNKGSWTWTVLLSMMTLSLLITAIDQAHLHQLTSLDRNTAIGLPIGALAAAFGVESGIELTARFSKSPSFVKAAWTLPVLVLLLVGVAHPWGAHTTLRVVRVASYIQHRYRHGTYVAALRGSDLNVERLYINDIPGKSWVYTSQPIFAKLFASHKISVIVLNYWTRKPAAEGNAIRMLQATPGWTLSRSFGFGRSATQIWCYRPPIAKKKAA